MERSRFDHDCDEGYIVHSMFRREDVEDRSSMYKKSKGDKRGEKDIEDEGDGVVCRSEREGVSVVTSEDDIDDAHNYLVRGSAGVRLIRNQV